MGLGYDFYRKLVSRIAILGSFLFSNHAIALTNTCRNLTVSLPNSTYLLNNIAGPNPAAQLEVVVTRSSSATLTQACTGFIAIGPGSNDSPSTYYSRRLRRSSYYIPYNYYSTSDYSNTNVVEGCSAISASHFIPFTIPVGQTSTPAGQRPKYIVRLGDLSTTSGPLAIYSDSSLVRAYEGTPGDCSSPGGSASSTIQYRVDNQLDISSTSQQISYGELELGDTGTAGLVVTHNGTGFRLAVRSENGSKLTHTQVPTSWNYEMRFKRGTSSFGSWRTLPTIWTYYSELTQSSGSTTVNISIDTRVVGPAPIDPLAGTYVDTVYFEVTPY